MKKPSYADLLADRDRHRTAHYLYEKALSLVVNDKPDTVQRYKLDKAVSVELRAYGLTSASGGIVVSVSKVKPSGLGKGQRPQVDADYLDTHRAHIAQHPSGYPFETLQAFDRISSVQYKLLHPTGDDLPEYGPTGQELSSYDPRPTQAEWSGTPLVDSEQVADTEANS